MIYFDATTSFVLLLSLGAFIASLNIGGRIAFGDTISALQLAFSLVLIGQAVALALFRPVSLPAAAIASVLLTALLCSRPVFWVLHERKRRLPAR